MNFNNVAILTLCLSRNGDIRWSVQPNSGIAYAYVILTNSPESGKNLKYLEAGRAHVLVTLH